MDITELREEYTRSGLSLDNLNPDPMVQFEMWFCQAQEANIPEPNAMSIATTSAAGAPSLRTVLLKYFDNKGFVFFTHYESNKAREIEENPQVALLFLWLGLQRQVIIKGQAEKISKGETLKYFMSRPRSSQLGAWCSSQSSIISNRTILELKLDEMKRKFSNGKVPVPSFWGGYRVILDSIEFWQGRPSRLHDRFQYTRRETNGWQIDRLAP
ncbi:MAG: pyridoxamine 5'-phosphate oxidase [Endozoicomonadaceae bacterium]|nr:pyridoxamine 5'-phosphate oxidase [Endozoicomonadaceae bacterium]